MKYAKSLVILSVDKTKIDSSYPDGQFQINDYQFPPFRRDRDKYGGGKIVFMRLCLIKRTLPKFETKVPGTICIDYFLKRNENLETLFAEINLSLSTIVNEYDNIMLIGALNTKWNNNSYYSDLCDTFDLTNLIKANTCFKSSNQTSIDVLLTNRPRSFQKSGVITTGLSDCNKMILTFFRSSFSRLPPKTITYRRFRYFETKDFLYELENKLSSKECNGELKYDDLTNIFRSTLDNHAALKQKQLRGNQAPFMTKELSKAITTRSRIKNKYNKCSSREKFLALKQIKNKCTNLTLTVKNNILQNLLKTTL